MLQSFNQLFLSAMLTLNHKMAQYVYNRLPHTYLSLYGDYEKGQGGFYY